MCVTVSEYVLLFHVEEYVPYLHDPDGICPVNLGVLGQLLPERGHAPFQVFSLSSVLQVHVCFCCLVGLGRLHHNIQEEYHHSLQHTTSPWLYLVVVVEVLPVESLDGFLEVLGLLDEPGGVVQPRLHCTQLHLKVVHLQLGGERLKIAWWKVVLDDGTITHTHTHTCMHKQSCTHTHTYLLSFLKHLPAGGV